MTDGSDDERPRADGGEEACASASIGELHSLSLELEPGA